MALPKQRSVEEMSVVRRGTVKWMTIMNPHEPLKPHKGSTKTPCELTKYVATVYQASVLFSWNSFLQVALVSIGGLATRSESECKTKKGAKLSVFQFK